MFSRKPLLFPIFTDFIKQCLAELATTSPLHFFLCVFIDESSNVYFEIFFGRFFLQFFVAFNLHKVSTEQKTNQGTYRCVSTAIRDVVHITSLLIFFNFDHVRDRVELSTCGVIGRVTSLLGALNTTALDAAKLALESHACRRHSVCFDDFEIC